jgi:hypothetical protein
MFAFSIFPALGMTGNGRKLPSGVSAKHRFPYAPKKVVYARPIDKKTR